MYEETALRKINNEDTTNCRLSLSCIGRGDDVNMTAFGKFGAYGMMQGAKVEADTSRMQMSTDKSRSLCPIPRSGASPPPLRAPLEPSLFYYADVLGKEVNVAESHALFHLGIARATRLHAVTP